MTATCKLLSFALLSILVTVFGASQQAEAQSRTINIPPAVVVPEGARAFDQLADVRRDYGVNDIQNIGKLDGTGQIIAIIDTGVDYNHPFLKGRVLAGACFSHVSPARWSAGWRPTCRPTAQHRYPQQDTSPGAGTACRARFFDPTLRKWVANKDCGHGTHVAGIAAGARMAGVTYPASAPMSGIAPKAKILPINVTIYKQSGSGADQLNITNQNLKLALKFVLAKRKAGMKIAAVNMSLASDAGFAKGCARDPDFDSEIASLIYQLDKAGVFVVAASGNAGHQTAAAGIGDPACYHGVFDVANMDSRGKIFSTSNFGNDIYPGVNTMSSDIINVVNANGSVSSTRTYTMRTGTSQAAPILSGFFALVKQAGSKLDLGQLDDGSYESYFPAYQNNPANCTPGEDCNLLWAKAGPKPFDTEAIASSHLGTTLAYAAGTVPYIYVEKRGRTIKFACRMIIYDPPPPPPKASKKWDCDYNEFLVLGPGPLAHFNVKVTAATPITVNNATGGAGQYRVGPVSFKLPSSTPLGTYFGKVTITNVTDPRQTPIVLPIKVTRQEDIVTPFY